MANIFFQDTSELLEKFALDENEKYFDPIKLGDRKVAFSIKRKYPNDISYKPALRRDNKPDNVVAIWVVYTHPNESSTELNSNHVPIHVRVSTLSKYLSNHFDYDYKDDDSPTEVSVTQSLSTPKPYDLEYPDEFFYDHSRNLILNKEGKSLSGIDLLDLAYTDHCNTVHWLKGLKLRGKIFLRSKSTALISPFILIFTWILKWIFGRTIEEDAHAFAYLQGYKRENYKKLNTDSLNFFGYKASKSVIILFCVLSILGAWCQHLNGGLNEYISYIGSSNYLTIVHSIFLLWILDVVVPYYIFKTINILISIRTFISFMKFKS